MTSRKSNHEQAPLAAEFIKQFREIFGDDVKALYVKEGEFEIGTKPNDEDRCPSEVK